MLWLLKNRRQKVNGSLNSVRASAVRGDRRNQVAQHFALCDGCFTSGLPVVESPDWQIRCSKCGQLLILECGSALRALAQCSCGAILKINERERSVISQSSHNEAPTLIPYALDRRRVWKWVAVAAIVLAVLVGIALQVR